MSTVSRRKHHPYPWDKWFAGTHFKLQRGKGKDYQCQTHSMVAQIRGAAAKRGVSVSIEVSESTIIVTLVE